MADPIEHLAVLAEQAGKLRTAEWLRTCALLPPEQWPPAPAYKGPMVPAADLDLAVWLHAEATWQREHARNLFPDHYNAASGTADRVGELEAALRERTTQRDALQARIDEIRAVLGEDAATRARFQVDVSTSYGPRFLSRIRAIVERDGDQPEVAGG